MALGATRTAVFRQVIAEMADPAVAGDLSRLAIDGETGYGVGFIPYSPQ